MDAAGQELSPCSEPKARELVAAGRAHILSEQPFAIQLAYVVNLPESSPPTVETERQGGRLLLHICCGPCATYTTQRLRELGYDVTGLWYNPNIHPFSEHERRQETLGQFAQQADLEVIACEGYEMPEFLWRVVGHERYRERCLICYEMRLRRTAQVAAERGFDAFTTTLLISPYQDQAAIRRIGEELAEEMGVSFFFENLRRGFAEHHRMSRELNLYIQRYCGCIYSEWEALDVSAPTHAPRKPR